MVSATRGRTTEMLAVLRRWTTQQSAQLHPIAIDRARTRRQMADDANLGARSFADFAMPLGTCFTTTVCNSFFSKHFIRA